MEEMNMDTNFEASLEIGKLAEALAMAQGMMENASKSSANPFFKSKYADLAEVWNTIREPLSKNGLSVVQAPVGIDGRSVKILTMLLHKSGQYIRTVTTIPCAKSDAQGIGSALTYGRRYALSALVGIAQEDDDGNAAVANNSTATPRRQARRAPPAKQLACAEQLGAMRSALEEKMSGINIEDFCQTVYKRPFARLTEAEANSVIERTDASLKYYIEQKSKQEPEK